MRSEIASDLSERTGAVVECHPFDIGYWSRVAGDDRRELRSRESRAGWDTADEELRSEQR